MTNSDTSIINADAEQRCRYLLNQVLATKEIWILTDEHGCVMLNSDEEDCVPVWPNEAFAKTWATGEWQDCKPLAIDLKTWQSRWIPGLIDDELAIAVFPDDNQDGLIYFPDEFEFELDKTAKKRAKN